MEGECTEKQREEAGVIHVLSDRGGGFSAHPHLIQNRCHGDIHIFLNVCIYMRFLFRHIYFLFFFSF